MRLLPRRAASPQARPRPRRRVAVASLLAVASVTTAVVLAVTSPGAPPPPAAAVAPPVSADVSEVALPSGWWTTRYPWLFTTTTTPRPTTTTARPTTTTPRPTTTTPRPTTTTPRPTTTAPPANDVLSQVVALVNQERAKAGCLAVTRNAQLDAAAQGQSNFQASTQTMTHTGAGGSNPGQRITAAGYTWRMYGENVAWNQPTAAAVMTAWMNSPGHRANILNCGFREIGVGVATSNGPYWTQDFATRF